MAFTATERRQLRKRQRNELAGYVAWHVALFRIVLFILAVGVVALLARDLQLRVSGAMGPPVWLVVPLACGVFLYRRAPTGGPAFRRQVRADLSGGEYLAHRIDVIDAVMAVPAQNEGPTVFLLTPSGAVFAFAGQYLERHVQRGFPWRAFEILEAPQSKVFFGLRALDGAFPPSVVRQPLTYEEMKQYDLLNRKYALQNVEFRAIREAAQQRVAADEGPLRSAGARGASLRAAPRERH